MNKLHRFLPLLICLACLTAYGQITNTPPLPLPTDPPVTPAPGVPPAVRDTIQPLLDLLGGKGTVLLTAVSWCAAIALILAPFAGVISRQLRNVQNQAAASSDLDDDEYLRKLYSQSWYRFTAFALRFLNVHLPTLAELERQIAFQTEAATKALAESKTATNPT